MLAIFDCIGSGNSGGVVFDIPTIIKLDLKVPSNPTTTTAQVPSTEFTVCSTTTTVQVPSASSITIVNEDELALSASNIKDQGKSFEELVIGKTYVLVNPPSLNRGSSTSTTTITAIPTPLPDKTLPGETLLDKTLPDKKVRNVGQRTA